MLSRHTCDYTMSISLHGRLISLSTARSGAHEGRVDVQKLLILLAGVLAECLMDYEDPFKELELFDRARIRNSNLLTECPDHTARHGNIDDWAPVLSILDLDRKLELGRSLARLYLDDTDEGSCVLKNAIAHLLETSLSMWSGDPVTAMLQHRFFIRAVHYALAFEIVAHQFCDRIIDLKISQEKWSLGDCIMAMSGLAGRYYAFAVLKEDDEYGDAKTAAAVSALFKDGSLVDFSQDDEDDDAYIYGSAKSYAVFGKNPTQRGARSVMQIMVGEAVRMGVPEGSGLFYGLAANDVDHRTAPHLIYSLEPSFAVLSERYNLNDYAVRSVAVSKAAGRMIAVASSGKDPEMEHIVARPLALSSFLGSLRHFSPRD